MALTIASTSSPSIDALPHLDMISFSPIVMRLPESITGMHELGAVLIIVFVCVV